MDLDKYIYAFVLLLNLVVIADFVDVITMESDWRMYLFIFVILFIMYYTYIYISGWIFQKVLAEIVQKDLILSQKALISNRRNLGLFAPTSMRFPSKDSKSKDLSF